jgi:ABC-type glutathione transport system ATPase component
VLQVTNLTVGYPGRPRVVDGISLSIDAGEVVGLSGQSGCGKTTLALSVMGLLPTDAVVSGSISFHGRELRDMRERDLETVRGAEIGLVFQESALALNPVLTVGAQLTAVVRAHHRCSRQAAIARARAALADVGFGGERTRVFDAYPHELSGGQRQRILIAQATVCQPALVIADEPVASLDDASRGEVLTLIRSLTERLGTSFLLITHSTEVLASTADRVVDMDAGTVAERTGHVRRPAITLSAPRPARLTEANVCDPVVEVAGLSKTYRCRRIFGKSGPDIEALKGVHLAIARGSTLGIAGTSGSGKSTLARCIAALERPDAGEVRVNGINISRLSERDLRAHRNQVQIIFQDSAAALNPRFCALDIVSEALVIQRIGTPAERRDRSADLMTRVGLSPDRLASRPGEFSGGERQRLAIARALAVSPRVLILDEAFSGLDVATRERIVQLLLDLQATHDLTYMCISHDLDLLARFAREIVVMHDGQAGPPSRGFMPHGAVA